MAKASDLDKASGDADSAVPPPSVRGGKKKTIVISAVVAVVLGVLGLAYAFGFIPKFSGRDDVHKAETSSPGSVDVAEIVANLNAGPRRTAFVRLKAQLELSSKADEAGVQAAQPRIRDLFQTYLRDMRPEELRGSAGTYRLREELLARANIALAPARVTEILFVELLIQ
jgi:flagellar FliL protein